VAMLIQPPPVTFAAAAWTVTSTSVAVEQAL
jgi:hypothetical protein